MDVELSRLRVRGLLSLRDTTLEPGRITVIIGPNGVGKSNLLAALRLLAYIRTRSLWRFVKSDGPASSLLHDGPKTTDAIHLEATFRREAGAHTYRATLGYAAGEALIFDDEVVESSTADDPEPMRVPLGQGHRESRLEHGGQTGQSLDHCLAQLNFFHFHDTSNRSALRTASPRYQTDTLKSDGSNLAAYLYALQTGSERDHQVAWRRINHLIRRVVPSIGELAPRLLTDDSVLLTWRDDRGRTLGPQRLSDGTLRAIALVTALAQPVAHLPAFISIDEPELGLHPAALGVLAGLIRSASNHSQIVLATQSPPLLDLFDPEDVIVCERDQGATTLRRLDVDVLEHWLADYRLSELYDQNVLGGRP